MMTVYCAAIVLVSISEIEGHILRLQCTMFADFSIKMVDKKLNANPVKVNTAIDASTCKMECLLHPACKAINYSDDHGKCEILPKSFHDPRDTDIELLSRESWDYYTTDFNSRTVGQNCKASNPCQSDEICVDKCSIPGFECLKCNNLAGHETGVHCNG